VRIGIFFSGNFIRHYEIKELQNLLKTKNNFIFFFDKKDEKKKSNFFSIIKNLIFKHKFFSLVILEEKISNILKHKKCYSKKLKLLNKKIKLENIIKNFSSYKIYNFKSNSKKFTPNAKLAKFIKKNCDILVFLGFNKIVDKKMINLVKNGILSFHTADINYYRGRPSAFYEFMNNEKFGGVTLQKIGAKIDSGKIVVLKKTNISKCNSYQETLFKMMSLKKNMLVEAIDKIKRGKKFYETKNKVEINIENNSRKLSVVLRYLIKTIHMKYFD